MEIYKYDYHQTINNSFKGVVFLLRSCVPFKELVFKMKIEKRIILGADSLSAARIVLKPLIVYRRGSDYA